MTRSRQLQDWISPISLRASGAAIALAILLALTIFTTQPAQAQTYSFNVLHNFTGGADGGYPYSSLLPGHRNNHWFNNVVYGTTYQGGSSNLGTIFQVDTSGNQTVLYNFSGSDGANPVGALSWASNGFGGANNSTSFSARQREAGPPGMERYST